MRECENVISWANETNGTKGPIHSLTDSLDLSTRLSMKVVQIQLSLKGLVLGLVEVPNHPGLGKDFGLRNQKLFAAGRPTNHVLLVGGVGLLQHFVELDRKGFLVGLARRSGTKSMVRLLAS